jgi:hypothetical protein
MSNEQITEGGARRRGEKVKLNIPPRDLQKDITLLIPKYVDINGLCNYLLFVQYISPALEQW